MPITENGRKRNHDEISLISVKKIRGDSVNLFKKLPYEILCQIMDNLNKQDIINLSCINREYREFLMLRIFESVKLKWKEIEEFTESFKHIERVHNIRIVCDLENEKETNNGEWNVSFKKLFERCSRLQSLNIGLLNSSRCLKYKDDFEYSISDKIKEVKLVSHTVYEDGNNDKSLFELVQLHRFKQVERLSLKGFCISKDEYFLPHLNEDLSNYEECKSDGKLIHLKEIELINCSWVYPSSLKDVFAPEYPLPDIMTNMGSRGCMSNCQPEKLRLVFDRRHSKFMGCERFKSFIDNNYNQRFKYEVYFFMRLRELEIDIVDDNFAVGESGETEKKKLDPEIISYTPWIDMINLGREFSYIDEDTGRVIKTSIIGQLRRIRLKGWKSSGISAWAKFLKGGGKLEAVEVDSEWIDDVKGIFDEMSITGKRKPNVIRAV